MQDSALNGTSDRTNGRPLTFMVTFLLEWLLAPTGVGDDRKK